MALDIPNSIDVGSEITAAEHEQNYQAIETHINTEVIHRDGSVAFTQPQQGVTPVADSDLATKAYVDSDYVAYTPTLTATVANPTGHSTSGMVQKVGRRVTGAAIFTIGSDPGSGAYELSLPHPADTFFRGYAVGVARTNNSGSSQGNGFVVISDDGLRLFIQGETGSLYGATHPFTWGNDDFARVTFEYQAAS